MEVALYLSELVAESFGLFGSRESGALPPPCGSADVEALNAEHRGLLDPALLCGQKARGLWHKIISRFRAVGQD